MDRFQMPDWAVIQQDNLVSAMVKTLQCDDACRIERHQDAMGDMVLVHMRGESREKLFIKPIMSVDSAENVRQMIELLEPWKALHWAEPIPNWVGEG